MTSNLITQKLNIARQELHKYGRLFSPAFAEVRVFYGFLAVAILFTVYYFLDINDYLVRNNYFIDKDIAHINAQFFLATIVGGFVAIYYHNWETRRARDKQDKDKEREALKQAQDKEREIRELNRAALVEFHRSTNDLQNDFKKIRRSLRSASFVDEAGERWIERVDFECLMERFEDCQLKAESLYRQAKARGDLFGFKQVREAEGDEGTSFETNSDDSGTIIRSNDPGTVVKQNLCNTKRYFRKAVRSYERNFLERRALTPKELLAIKDVVLKEVIANEKSDSDSLDTVRTSLLQMISDSSRG